MTSTKGDTIKDGLGLSSNHNDASIMNRVFAFEVMCGEIEFMMYISHDQTIDKGANLAGERFLILNINIHSLTYWVSGTS